MSYDHNKARAAWRKVATTACGAAFARDIAKRSLIQMNTGSLRMAFDAALEAAPNLRDAEGGHSWGTLELLGVKRDEVPQILEALGAPCEEITEAVKSPESAYASLKKWAKAYRDPKPTQLPDLGRFE